MTVSRPVKILAIVSGVGRGHAARTRPILEALAVQGHDCTAAVLGRRAASFLAPVCPVLPPPDDFHRRVAPPAATARSNGASRSSGSSVGRSVLSPVVLTIATASGRSPRSGAGPPSTDHSIGPT